MSTTRKRYDEEFKKQIVRQLEQGASIHEISRQYGIAHSMLHQWKEAYATIGVTPEGEVVTKADFRKLQKKIAQLELENEILRKAQEFFRHNKTSNSFDDR